MADEGETAVGDDFKDAHEPLWGQVNGAVLGKPSAVDPGCIFDMCSNCVRCDDDCHEKDAEYAVC